MTDEHASNGNAGPAHCPICGRSLASTGADPAAAPFCSQRCRQIDLGNWLGEQYTISRPIEQADLEKDD